MMNSSRATRGFRLYPLGVTLAALALLSLALVARAKADQDRDPRAPELGDCQNLQVLPGNVVDHHFFGVGVQIYTWTGTTWSFVSPEALLFADSRDHTVVAFHFAGPTWESLGGSEVVGTLIDHCTPDPDAIPWLLLGATPSGAPGIFEHVTFIQRLYTVGGKAPSAHGDFPGQVARVPYTADYFFYRKQR